MDEFDKVVTNDLALVAYLKLKAHTARSCTWDSADNVCRWEFSSDAVQDSSDFLNDRATVNPRDFTRCFGQAKREMYRAKSELAL